MESLLGGPNGHQRGISLSFVLSCSLLRCSSSLQVSPLIERALSHPESLISPEQQAFAAANVAPLNNGKPRVGIIGARGYTGNELMKLILKHEHMELAAVSSRQLVGKRISSNLKGLYPGSDAGENVVTCESVCFHLPLF